MKIGIGYSLRFHDHAFVKLPTVENSGNYGAVQKFQNFYCRLSITCWKFWQNFMKFGGVIREVWNYEENCSVLDTNYVIMY